MNNSAIALRAASTPSASATRSTSIGRPLAIRATISFSASRPGYPTRTFNMKRSSWASGSGYVPSCSIGGETFFLGEPFLVLATQNPIEHEGTYRLREAQRDCFMLKVRVGYPGRDAEKEIVARMASGRPIEVERVADAEGVLAARSAIAELFMDQKVVDYIVDVVRATREPEAVGLRELKTLIAFGASPRASIYLAQAARAHAYLRGRAYVVPEDVKAMAYDVLRHRVLLTFEAEAEDTNADRVIGKILEAVGVP